MSENPDFRVPTDHCPDKHCGVPIGAPHKVDCDVAVCVRTGGQRILHHSDPPPANLGAEHNCGADVWTGHLHGVIEAVAYGLFVRPANDQDAPLTRGWVPCDHDDAGAAPDLDRLHRTGRWNPDRRRWELAPEAAGCG